LGSLRRSVVRSLQSRFRNSTSIKSIIYFCAFSQKWTLTDIKLLTNDLKTCTYPDIIL
jgi:hypothetical protein